MVVEFVSLPSFLSLTTPFWWSMWPSWQLCSNMKWDTLKMELISWKAEQGDRNQVFGDIFELAGNKSQSLPTSGLSKSLYISKWNGGYGIICNSKMLETTRIFIHSENVLINYKSIHCVIVSSILNRIISFYNFYF